MCLMIWLPSSYLPVFRQNHKTALPRNTFFRNNAGADVWFKVVIRRRPRRIVRSSRCVGPDVGIIELIEDGLDAVALNGDVTHQIIVFLMLQVVEREVPVGLQLPLCPHRWQLRLGKGRSDRWREDVR